ncbi:hypothetical protein [Gimesia sp.]|uniref:hypothetical protein n=1 Tax=Gimesia sp. TaxID=2024833 RepID=UPI003A94CCFA
MFFRKKKNKQGIPSCCVNKNLKSGHYLLVSEVLAPETGANFTWGNLLEITELEMQKEGLSIIMKDLEAYHDRNADGRSEIDKMSQEEHFTFLKNHDCVCISMCDEEQLRLSPMKTDLNGSGRGKQEDQIFVDLNCSNDEFYNALIQAFKTCETFH